MIISIDTQKIEDPNQFGELLRNYCFTPDEYEGNTGCYSTFKLKEEFKEVSKNSSLGQELILLLTHDYSLDYKKEILDRIKIYSNSSIHLVWYWDGDGVLLIIEKNKGAINHDCKNDYEWEWL